MIHKWFKRNTKPHTNDGFLSIGDIQKDERYELKDIHDEFKRGFDLIKKYPKTVSFFGSARFTSEHEHYKQAQELAGKIVKELGYAVVTGGGPGIMEAGARGAKDAGGVSIGMTIRLPHEQRDNPYITESADFKYFFSRKTLLTFEAEAFIFFPGGFGTLDEFFDVLTLVQTGKIPKVPIILVGRDYWEPLDAFIKAQMLVAHKAINPDDMKLYHITEDSKEIVEIIRKTPVTNWWKHFQE
ncbi:MAG: TIGR00730 family Rossman fold protein [Patescibacteria group bacterium]